MHDDQSARNNQSTGHEDVPSKADFPSPRRLEALGEGYDDRDRTLDAALTGEARRFFASSCPSGLADRIYEASMDALADHQAPRRFAPEPAQHRPTHVFQRLALAACMGLAVAGAWWLPMSGDRVDPVQSTMLAQQEVVEVVPVQNADSMNAEAEWAMLASARGNLELDQLVALVATRDVGFADVTGDLSAILDAMQNPHLQAFDLEWSR